VKVAISSLYATDPATAVPPGPAKVKVEVVIEAGFIAILNVAVTVVLMTTPVAPCAGVTDTTPGRLTVS
jgi:hypothetical protein